jgi:hypothetical protein
VAPGEVDRSTAEIAQRLLRVAEFAAEIADWVVTQLKGAPPLIRRFARHPHLPVDCQHIKL